MEDVSSSPTYQRFSLLKKPKQVSPRQFATFSPTTRATRTQRHARCELNAFRCFLRA